MLTQFLLLLRRKSLEDYDASFVRDVRVANPEPRSRRVEWVLIVSWILILLKSVLVWWAIRTYRVPINAWWIIGPTLGMGAVCTALYVWRR